MYYTVEPTELLYMTDLSTSFFGSEVVDTFKNENGKQVLVLDKTIMYPQGGGQPFDTGTISTANSKFRVDEVRFVEGIVHHIGEFVNGEIGVGEKVQIEIDKGRRDINSKLHSSGHLIDIALRNIGLTEIIPLKGYHFSDGPYVEYIGEINSEDIVKNLQAELDKLIETGYEVKTKMSSLDEAKSVCYFLPDHMPDNKPIRIVSVWGDKYIPCGGTHVTNINELKGLQVKEIKSKKGNTRVSYTLL